MLALVLQYLLRLQNKLSLLFLFHNINAQISLDSLLLVVLTHHHSLLHILYTTHLDFLSPFLDKSDMTVDCDSNSMDYTVLIDSVLLALTDPCKEVCQTSLMALKLICETTVALLGSIKKVIVGNF